MESQTSTDLPWSFQIDIGQQGELLLPPTVQLIEISEASFILQHNKEGHQLDTN